MAVNRAFPLRPRATPGVRRRRGRAAARRHHGTQRLSRHLRRPLGRRSARRASRSTARSPPRGSNRSEGRLPDDARRLPQAQLGFERRSTPWTRRPLRERIENLSATDSPVGWTQHVTLGPPFLEKGRTQFRVPATPFEGVRRDVRSRRLPRCAAPSSTGRRRRALAGGARICGRSRMRPPSSAYTAHQMDPARRARALRRVLTGGPARFRLRVAPRRLSLAGHLGGEPRAAGGAVEQPRAHLRHGIRRLAVSRNAPRR